MSESNHDAVEPASAETGLPVEQFPAECPYTLDALLAIDLPEIV